MPWHLQNPDAIYPCSRTFPNNFNKDREFFNEKRIFVFLQPMPKRILVIALIWVALLGVFLCLPGKAWLHTWLPLFLLYLVNHLLFTRLYLKEKRVWYGLAVVFALSLTLFSVHLILLNAHPSPPPFREERPAFEPDSSRMMPPPPPRPGEMPPPPHGPHGGEAPPPPLPRETVPMLLAILIIGLDNNLSLRHFRKKDGTGAVQNSSTTPESSGGLYFKSDRQMVKVLPEDILYIEGMGEYVKIWRRSEAAPLVTFYRMGRLLEELPDGFIQIHRSYIVAVSAVTRFSRSEAVLSSGVTLPVGPHYRERFLARMTGSA